MSKKLNFSTKAGTLKKLQGLLKNGSIAPIFSFSVSCWQESKDDCLKNIPKILGVGPWIVRSSCKNEDGHNISNAGKFLSIPNVNFKSLSIAIDKIIESYESLDKNDEVLIQPMLTNVIKSGVAFSHDPNTCSPYRIINWNDGENTFSVTSGKHNGNIWQQSALKPRGIESRSYKFNNVIKLIEELLELFGNKPLDIEFAITRYKEQDCLWLLQVRSLILRSKPESNYSQKKRLKIIHNKLEESIAPHPFLMGKRTVFGIMPDWNPAEIIGIRPKPLALSLYRELVTDNIWAYQRHNYGYRNLRSFPLMKNFFGLPYIDVRLSFNSFIPADLDNKLACKLVDYYIDRLEKKPTLHDKVEFEIVYSCYTLDLDERLNHLFKAGFSASEVNKISTSLLKLTNRILNPKEGLWKNDAKKFNTLDLRRKKLFESNLNYLEVIYWLIEDTKRYGTLPFAGLARVGFIAVQILKSLVTKDIFSQKDYDNFLKNISTISSQISNDKNNLKKEIFLNKYGHLRPGTYDILSYRYDEKPDLYFNWKQNSTPNKKQTNFSLSKSQRSKIELLLMKNKLKISAIELMDFIKQGIELRELGKFFFTKNLSDTLDIINKFGNSLGFQRKELSYSNIDTFKELYIKSEDEKKILKKSINKGMLDYAQTLKTSLPFIITEPSEVWGFKWASSVPNFITQNQITAPVVGSKDLDKLQGSIVCLPNADPGFDWLFSHPIVGLITSWGGVNSHMAIRAGELGLPAVIGCGEIEYERWSQAEIICIDCANKVVKVIR